MDIKKILIANRGEIAVRILRTCKELGIETVSVHSEEDESSLHVKLADESVCIGPAKSTYSYLNIPAILSAAEITKADAIHPGFGFLSENKEFAYNCKRWGLEFIGPNLESIEMMGSKVLSKQLAEKAGVPILKTVPLNNRPKEDILKDVNKIGYPMLIKASAGGGGRGMRKVENDSELLKAIVVMEEEAKNAFGDSTLFAEKYIGNPRHIEVQILADRKGNIIHLGERDCTIQRRYQKILEESPSVILTSEKRAEICKSAIKLAKLVNYDSVGTVEFLYDLDSAEFYFMEMNTRIQVEHPVTEERTGIDLIAEQIKVAGNNKLKWKQKDITFNGHVIEFRINAEDPQNFMPSPGKITHYYRPGGIGVRVDDFIYSGYRVSPHYDSMIAKVIVYAENREQCLSRSKRALDEIIIEGIKTNIPLHQLILNSEQFSKSHYNTHFLTSYLT